MRALVVLFNVDVVFELTDIISMSSLRIELLHAVVVLT